MRRLAEEAALERASDANGENGALLDNAKALVRRKDVADWCKEVASDNGARIWPADAAAAVAGAYFQAVLETQPLFRSYTDQVAAILVNVLKEAVLKMKLRIFAGDGEPSGAEPDAGKAFVWESIYVPLARHVLASLASLRLVDELNGPGKRTVCPFAWTPGLDSLQRALEFILLGQALSGRLHAGFLYSRFARYVVRAGYAGIVPFQTFQCNECRRRVYRLIESDRCRVCGGVLESEIKPQCLAITYLSRCTAHADNNGKLYFSAFDVPVYAPVANRVLLTRGFGPAEA